MQHSPRAWYNTVMADEWYCEISGREVGPLSSQQLRTMAAKGQIWPNDRVRRGEQVPWLPAQNVKGLFPPPAEVAAPNPPSPPPPPPSSSSSGDTEGPIAIDIGMDFPTSIRRTQTSLEVAAHLRAKRRRQQQRTMFFALVITVVGLTIAGLMLVFGNSSGSTPSKKSPAKKTDANSRDVPESLEGDDLLAPAKVEKRKSSINRPQEKRTAKPRKSGRVENSSAALPSEKRNGSSAAESKKKPHEPQPGTPEGDFGIGETDEAVQ
jgi:hypothetical protein